MPADEPSCPRCTGPIRADWDWCHHCGYDPDLLKPAGWMPPRPNGPVDLTAPARPAEPVGRPARRRRSNKLPVTPAAANPTTHAGARGTTFVLPPTALERAGAAVLTLLSAFMVFVAGSSLRSLTGSSGLFNKMVTLLFIVICLILASGMTAQAYALIRTRVVLSSTELRAHNRLGLPHKVAIDEIFSVTPSSRRYDIGFGISRTAEVPYVQVGDGAGFWIDALGGRSGQDPSTEQAIVLDQLSRSVAGHRVAPPTA